MNLQRICANQENVLEIKWRHEPRRFRPSEKGALAGSVLESLDDTVDERAEEEWNKEIAHRIAELDSGKVKPVPWAEARRQISVILK